MNKSFHDGQRDAMLYGAINKSGKEKVAQIYGVNIQMLEALYAVVKEEATMVNGMRCIQQVGEAIRISEKITTKF